MQLALADNQQTLQYLMSSYNQRTYFTKSQVKPALIMRYSGIPSFSAAHPGTQVLSLGTRIAMASLTWENPTMQINYVRDQGQDPSLRSRSTGLVSWALMPPSWIN